jgi:hypothetical protein
MGAQHPLVLHAFPIACALPVQKPAAGVQIVRKASRKGTDMIVVQIRRALQSVYSLLDRFGQLQAL